MFIIQSGNSLLARVVTVYGDEFVGINLEDGVYEGADARYQSYPKWTAAVAQTYRDLVIAKEIPGRAKSSIRSDNGPESNEIIISEPFDSGPQIVYIPRTFRKNTPTI